MNTPLSEEQRDEVIRATSMLKEQVACESIQKALVSLEEKIAMYEEEFGVPFPDASRVLALTAIGFVTPYAIRYKELQVDFMIEDNGTILLALEMDRLMLTCLLSEGNRSMVHGRIPLVHYASLQGGMQAFLSIVDEGKE